MNGKRLTVLYLIETTDPGGAEIALLNLAAGLNREQFRPVVGLLRDGWLRSALVKQGVEVAILPSVGKGLVDLTLLRGIARLARETKADVIHAFMFYMNLYGVLAGKMAHRPAIAGVRGKGYDFGNSKRVLAYYLIGRLCTRMTVVSEDLDQYLMGVIGVPRSKLVVTPNGVDTDRFAPHPQFRTEVRGEYGIPEGAQVVGTVGRLERVKAQGDLLRVVSELEPRWPDLHLLIVGEGSERTSLEAQISELGISERVHLPGFRPDVEKAFAAMDVFCLPSLSEGMPNALLQAMASGLPAVATEVGGNSEVIKSGVNGFLTPPGDLYELVRQVEALLRDGELASRMGAAARQQVERTFSARSFVAQHQALYREVAGA